MITLCLDFGNSRLKAAVFNDAKLIEGFVFNDDPITQIQNLIDEFRPSKSVLASVINHDNNIEILLSNHTRFHKLSHSSKLNFSSGVFTIDFKFNIHSLIKSVVKLSNLDIPLFVANSSKSSRSV